MVPGRIAHIVTTMKSTRISSLSLSIALAIACLGCGLRGQPNGVLTDQDLEHYKYIATQIEYPDVVTPSSNELAIEMSPQSVGRDAPIEYSEIKLEECFQLALQNSSVLKDLGGLVLRAPATTTTVQGPAIVETDPRLGVEAALSQFDAIFSSHAYGQKNDRALNNTFFGGGTRQLQQDVFVLQSQITKKTATGSQFTLRHNTDYDGNNAPGNLFPSAWNTNYEAEMRQPLLRGAGLDFNRIAGPNAVPGFMNGVLLARVNTDIGLADFEVGVRDFVCNVENAYWDLYFAYRDLDAKMAARDAALESWRRIQALYAADRRGGEAEKEAEAREQYFRFQEDVQNAWTGRVLDGTRTGNGSTGGTLRGIGGVRVCERRLRLLVGLPISDGRLLRPADEPRTAKIAFDWNEVVCESLARRVELRRQRWVIKRREMELVASRNFLLPTLDAVGLYRWRGFGHDLLNPTRQPDPFDNAYQNLTSGNSQEWQLGLELSVPLGARLGHAALRNAQLLCARERAVLVEQERQVVHDLSNAMGDIDRAYDTMQTNFNRRIAARQELTAVQTAYDVDKAQLDQVLDAQRRLADAEIRYFGSMAEYALAIKNLHLEKGSLLDYNEIYLAEGPWPGKAYDDAELRHSLRAAPGVLNYILKEPARVSDGPAPQQTMSAEPIGHFAPWEQYHDEPRVPQDREPPPLPEPMPMPPETLGPAVRY